VPMILKSCKNWRIQSGAVVCDSTDPKHTHCDRENVAHYGGALICESIRSPEMATMIASIPEFHEALRLALSALITCNRSDLKIVNEAIQKADAVLTKTDRL
jgi:hypothetical protein